MLCKFYTFQISFQVKMHVNKETMTELRNRSKFEDLVSHPTNGFDHLFQLQENITKDLHFWFD